MESNFVEMNVVKMLKAKECQILGIISFTGYIFLIPLHIVLIQYIVFLGSVNEIGNFRTESSLIESSFTSLY